MNLLDLPTEILVLIFKSIPDRWALFSPSALQDRNFRPNPDSYVFSLDLWSLKSFVQTCRLLHQLFNSTLYQWDADFYSNRALRWAAEHGKIATARLALKVKHPENLCYKRWEYLYKAIVLDQEAIVRLLLEHGIDPNKTGYWDTEVEASGEDWHDYNINLLEKAERLGSEPIMKLLLDHGAGADRPTLRRILEGSARAGQYEIVKLIMENECGHQLMDPGELDAVLLKAIDGGCTTLVRFLLEKGSFSKERPPPRGSMDRAVCHSNPEITRLLLVFGADPCPEQPPGINVLPLSTAATLEHYAVAQLLRESVNLEAMIRSGGQNRDWLLLVAAACGWDDMVRQILDQGCSVDVTAAALGTFYSSNASGFERGCLPAISLAAGRGHYSTVQLLLSYDARWYPNSKYEEPNPLIHAVASGHLHVVELLVNHGADPNIIGRWYYPEKEIADLPCIYWAVTYPEIFRFLLDRGADLSLPVVKARIQMHRHPITSIITSISHRVDERAPIMTAPTSTHVLQKALQGGCAETLQILLERGIPLDPSDQVGCWGCKPVLIAAAMGGEAVTRLVLDYGLHVNLGSQLIEEAVNIAVTKVDFPLLKLLWDRGLLNSPCFSSGERNMLGIAESRYPGTDGDTHTAPSAMDLPAGNHVDMELGTSSLSKSPLDHIIAEGVAKGPRNTDIFVQFLLQQGAEPLGGTSFTQTPLALASRQGYHNLVLLLLRVIDRQNIAQEELLFKLSVLFLRKSIPEVESNNQISAYYAKRSRNLYRR